MTAYERPINDRELGSQTMKDSRGLDTYDSAIVAAATPDAASKIHPGIAKNWDDPKREAKYPTEAWSWDWASSDTHRCRD